MTSERYRPRDRALTFLRASRVASENPLSLENSFENKGMV
jgi:hypothetical protein